MDSILRCACSHGAALHFASGCEAPNCDCPLDRASLLDAEIRQADREQPRPPRAVPPPVEAPFSLN